MNDNGLLQVLGHDWLYAVTLIVAIWLIVNKLAEIESGALKLFGPLGRWVQRSYLKRSKRHQAEVSAELKRLAEEIIPRVSPADLDAVKGQLANVVTRLTEVEIEAGALRAYVIADERWHFEDELARAEKGINYIQPPRMSWPEFLARYQSGWRPDKQPARKLGQK